MFFFSSRRRHTRCGRDWSSDVCSSDLILFDQESTYLLIPSAILSLPISQSPATLRTFLKYSPANMLARPNPHESTTGKLRQLLSRHAINELPDLVESARLLGLSNATFRRRLAAENTSFQRLKDELRRSEERRVGKECRSRWSPYQ